MYQLFATDFIKSRVTQCIILLGIFADLLSSQSIQHILILSGLPYLVSIGLAYVMNPKKIKNKGYISEQYRNKPNCPR